MNRRLKQLIPNSAVSRVATNSTADVLEFSVPFRCALRQILVHQNASEATDAVIQFDKIDSGGTRGTADVGQVSFPDGTDYENYTVVDTPTSRVELNPGDQIIAQVTTASTGDKEAEITILVDLYGEQEVNNNALVTESVDP